MSIRCQSQRASGVEACQCIYPAGHAGGHVAYADDGRTIVTWAPEAPPPDTAPAATLADMLAHHADFAALLEHEGFRLYAVLVRKQIAIIRDSAAQFERDRRRP